MEYDTTFTYISFLKNIFDCVLDCLLKTHKVSLQIVDIINGADGHLSAKLYQGHHKPFNWLNLQRLNNLTTKIVINNVQSLNLSESLDKWAWLVEVLLLMYNSTLRTVYSVHLNYSANSFLAFL